MRNFYSYAATTLISGRRILKYQEAKGSLYTIFYGTESLLSDNEEGYAVKIKDWQKFQHFKDRRPPWIKLYRDLLDDEEYHKLSPLSAKYLPLIWLLASEDETREGLLPSASRIAFRLRVSEKSLLSIISELSHWLIRDDINPISERYQLGPSETETETYKTETEKISPLPSLQEGTIERGKTAFPLDWKPSNAEMEQWKVHGLVSPHEEFAIFKDHALTNDRRCKDWIAAWRNWCRKALRIKEERANGLYKMRS